MKKIIVGTLCTAFILGSATFAFAEGKEDKEIINFGQMKPHMEEMHPDLSTKELKEMFDSCHGNEGQATEQNMMNKL